MQGGLDVISTNKHSGWKLISVTLFGEQGPNLPFRDKCAAEFDTQHVSIFFSFVYVVPGAGTAGSLPKETYKIEIWMGRRRRNSRVGVGGSHAILYLYLVF